MTTKETKKELGVRRSGDSWGRMKSGVIRKRPFEVATKLGELGQTGTLISQPLGVEGKN